MSEDDRPSLIEWAFSGCDWYASRSKDPGRKVGAVILRPDNTVASGGYNGFPRKVNDAANLYANKPTKLLRTVHAEVNAIVMSREPLHGHTLYVTPLLPCANCAGVIIQAGITKVVARIGKDGGEGWKDSFEETVRLFEEAGVELEIHHSD